MAVRALSSSFSLGVLQPKNLSAPADKRTPLRVSCFARKESKVTFEASARNAALVAMTSAALLAPAQFAQAQDLEAALANCKTTFCTESTQRRIDNAAAASVVKSAPASAPAVVDAPEAVSKGPVADPKAERAAAAKAAKQEAEAAKVKAAEAAKQKVLVEEARVKAVAEKAESQRVAAIAQAAQDKRIAAEKAERHSILGDTVAAAFPTAILLAAGSTLVTGTSKDLLDGNFEAWLETNKKAFEDYPNKTVLGSAIALALVTDVAFGNVPLFNLLIPPVFELFGTTSMLYLAFRYLKEGAMADEDLKMFVSSTLPKELPQVSNVTERTTVVVNEAVDFAKLVNTEKLTEDAQKRFEEIDDKAVTAGYAVAFFAALYVTGYVFNLPVLNLVLPKTAELLGVIVSIVAVDRYAVSKSSTFAADFQTVEEKIVSLNLPGTIKKTAPKAEDSPN